MSLRQNLVGQRFVVNTVAIRVQTGEVSTMEELCAEVTERCLLAFQHQQYPFDQVIQDSSPKRGENSNPIFSTMFSYQQDVVQQHFSYQYQIYPVQTNISKFDLSLACEELNDEIVTLSNKSEAYSKWNRISSF
ncbi:condensation domain-containing protein, partial [Escherichia sp. SS-MK2]